MNFCAGSEVTIDDKNDDNSLGHSLLSLEMVPVGAKL